MLRPCLLALAIAGVSGARIQEREKALGGAAFLPGFPVAKLAGQPAVGIPFGAGRPKAGERSGWQYSLFRQVRQTPFGHVWRAFDNEKVRQVHLALYQENGERSELAEQSVEECMRSLELHNGNSSYPKGQDFICKCLESRVNKYDGVFLVMEDCGEPLAEKLQQQWREPSEAFLESARGWMRDGLEALRYMSGLKVPMSHNDLQMDRLAVDSAGRLKIVDFRYLERSEDLERPWASDVYSLARIYYELLCRRKAADKAFRRDALKEKELTCDDGSFGIGTETDFAVLKAALAERSERASPEELMKILER